MGLGLSRYERMRRRLLYGFNQWPIRMGRMGMSIARDLPGRLYRGPHKDILFWPVEFTLLLLDCIFIPEFYEMAVNLFKSNMRGLNESEQEILCDIFSNSVRWDLVQIDDKALFGPKQHRFAYVSYFTINAHGPMANHVLVHELVHVWQFQKFGSIYILRALRAQFSSEKYNYGGVEKLKLVKTRNGNLLDFNFEQQADIIADYFLLSRNKPVQWGKAGITDVPVYKFFVDGLQHLTI